MDSVMQFRPQVVLTDTIEVYGSLDAVVPMLSRDSLEAIAKRTKEAAEAKEKAQKNKKGAKKSKK